MMTNIKLRIWFYKIAPLLIWLLLMVLPLFSGPGNFPAVMHHAFLKHMLLSNILLLILFYTHTFLVYPLTLKPGSGLWMYFGVLGLLLVVYVLIFEWLLPPMPLPFADTIPPAGFAHSAGSGNHRPFTGRGPGGFFPVLSPLIALLCSYCYRLILDQADKQALAKEREMIHLRTELNFLRAQVSPHFLFNVLNSMVALVRKKSDQLEPVIIQLSQLMRYMLYETDDKPVLLEKEIAYLQNYIQLQLLRFGGGVNVKATFPDDTGGLAIAPMLLIPLVENAFKHGTGMLERPIIIIVMAADDEEIRFQVINEITPADDSKEEQSGIGLANVQRRLQLLYPDSHSLNINRGEHAFIAELIIKL